MGNETTTFARTITNLRRARKLSQRTVARKLGVSQAQLSHYENGLREPRLPFVVAIAEFYGVTTDFLLIGAATESSGAAESAREGVKAVLAQALELGGSDTEGAAANYILAGVKRLTGAMEFPRAPYDPNDQIALSQALGDVIAAVRNALDDESSDENLTADE
ncbi:MAG: helix-turn-helix transcriptional regulator [Oscillospiraceae bacterium]|jgi:transcriptional regulator with XRE-family HTH domain|nr:helix-turn-helix transcriptional regulator [Oscillospiraceae bacterium]